MAIAVAQIVERTEAEGPGARFAVWVQGCSIRCANCCNPEMFPRKGGEDMDPLELAARVLGADVRGLTLLGGEPFEQARACAELARAVRAGGKTVVAFSGYTRAELERREDARELLAACDLLVDGPFLADSIDRARRWIGSTNQVIHFLTSAYSPADFLGRETAELRLTRDALVMNGWPGLIPDLRRSAR